MLLNFLERMEHRPESHAFQEEETILDFGF
jgi:hypothetical protein